MNNQMIQKITQSSNEICPEFSFKNPLLQLNVTKALSKSFVTILNVSQQNSRINSNLRLSILETIRKMCQIEPRYHVNINENVTELLAEFHNVNMKKQIETDIENTLEKTLDAFLLRRIEDCEVVSKYETKLNPEIIQSLINLKQNAIIDLLSKDVIYWNVNDTRYMCILKEMFTNNSICEKTELLDDISIKVIPEIEKLLLEICHELIENNNTDVNSLFSDNIYLMQLIKTCAGSPKCFQISCAILNFIFITSGFDSNVQTFVCNFINLVKSNCCNFPFFALYPIHVSHIVVLLDFNEADLSLTLKETYFQKTIKYLKNLHKENESDLIMLLSHFITWFDVYFDPKYSTV